MSISALFDIIAREWKKDRAKLQQYVDKFDDEMIDNVTDLISLAEKENDWNELTSSFPMGVRNRIKMKLS